MISTVFLREFSQLLQKHGASLEDLIGMVYTQDELDPLTGKYKNYFDLLTVYRDPMKYPEGFSYKTRYKTDLNGNRIPQGKVTYTTKTALINEAVKLGFDNRIEVLKNYEINKTKPESGKAFYKMLGNYYEEGSKYLLDDSACNKRDVVHKSRKEAKTFIETDLIPYLREKEIAHIQEITAPVYSGLKICLHEKGIKDKTINNRLNFFTRILEYHLRNGLLEKLPYTKGNALLRFTGKEEKEDAEILPVDNLKGVYPSENYIDPIALINFRHFNKPPKLSFDELNAKEKNFIFNDYILPFTLGILALNTGMRNSEAGRIKREDFLGVDEKETFLLRIWNKKTDYFNKTSESKYRKIPLHSFTIKAVRNYIWWKEKIYGDIQNTDFLFGNAVTDKDTGKIDGYLHYKTFDKTVLILLKLMKHKENYSDFFSTKEELVKTIKNNKALNEELKGIKEAGKGISFYSFRKTFRTMLGLNNDLAEYYMGHRLGDNSKTTYIQVNSLSNKLFVEEYAGPVIAMLEKYVFYSEDELIKMYEELGKDFKEHDSFISAKIEEGMSKQDAVSLYWIMQHLEEEKNKIDNREKRSEFNRI
jgi:integrase